MENFFNSLCDILATSPWWVQILLAFSIGLCVLSILSVFLCDLFFIPLYGVRVPQLPTLYIWQAGITLLIGILKTFHIPTKKLERCKNKYENDIRRLENIKEHIMRKAALKEPVQKEPSLSKHSYKDIEE
ncbi:hypothetical protein [Fibrobacter sp. UWB12]|uniref:hypothetical protein n=1 Tax=Fibrobacter sp. UWB12 TaxID=1896203 RepID=UPI00091351E8|nr:hypothetical protein [Fibrobacter sp. UWB12]SHK83721.1 hypothetical protein SAMN05720759_10787 [Fibrobacter sp. UWB12]